VDPTGITATTDFIEDVNVFPNPNGGRFSVNATFRTAQPTTLRVMDMTGRLVHTNRYSAATALNAELDLSAEPKGLYTVLLQTPEGQARTKVIIR
jgi:hypothetical protein